MKELKINPQIEDNSNIGDILEGTKGEINKTITKQEIIVKDGNSDDDTYFREILKQLDDKDNITTKTEYLDEAENFAIAKLDFLSTMDFDLLRTFTTHFKLNRVSLKRMGRTELIQALARREEEKRIQMEKQMQNPNKPLV